MMRASIIRNNNKNHELNFKTINKDNFESDAGSNKINNKFQMLYDKNNNQDAFMYPPAMSNWYGDFK